MLLVLETAGMLVVCVPRYCSAVLEYMGPFLWACCSPETPAHLRLRLVSALCRQAQLSRSPRPVHRALEMLSRLQVRKYAVVVCSHDILIVFPCFYVVFCTNRSAGNLTASCLPVFELLLLHV